MLWLGVFNSNVVAWSVRQVHYGPLHLLLEGGGGLGGGGDGGGLGGGGEGGGGEGGGLGVNTSQALYALVPLGPST